MTSRASVTPRWDPPVVVLSALCAAIVAGCGGGGGGGGAPPPPPPPTYTISGTVTGASAVTVTLGAAGAADRTTVTQGNGSYAFSGVANGQYSVTPTKASFTMTPLTTALTVNGADRPNIDFSASPSSGPTYAIAGTITKAWGGALAGVQVTVASSGATVGTVTTDTSGHFTLSGLSSGSYTVTPALAGWVFAPGAPTVTVSGADATQSFTADGAYAISGTVTTAWSTPLQGVSVALSGGGVTKAAVTTSASGVYTISGVPSGSYVVTPTRAGYLFDPAAPSVSVTTADVTRDFAADGAYHLTGAVRTVWGAPVAAIDVALSGGGVARNVATATDGTYSFAVPDGTFTVTPSGGGFTFVPSAPSVVMGAANRSQDFTARGAYAIGGTIVTAWGAPLPNVSLTVASGGHGLAAASTDASGRYTISGLPNGSYTVTPALAGWVFAPGAPTVAVSGADATQSFTADGAYTISGGVTQSGAALAGVSIALSGGGVVKPPAVSGIDGSYLFTAIPNGSYTLTPALAGHTISPAAPTVLVNGGNASQSFTATTGPTCTIGGTLTGAGLPLAGMTVRLSGSATAVQTTDASGAFAFNGLAPGGDYTVTPTVFGYSFSPTTRAFAALAANQTASFATTSPPPMAYTGTVSYAGTKSGPVYVAIGDGGTGLAPRAGPFAGRAFTIRTLPAGGGTVTAWMDTLGIGRYVAGVDPVATRNIGAAGLVPALGDLTLADPVGVPTIDSWNAVGLRQVIGFDQGAAIVFSPPKEMSGAEVADSHVVYWNTTTPVDAGHNVGSLVIPAGGKVAVVKGLTSGTSYWFRIVARVNGTPIPRQTALWPFAVVPGVRTGAATVTGTVTYPALPAPSALYVGADAASGETRFIQRIANPPGTSTTYSLSVPPGDYQLRVIVDLGDDGVLGAGEPTADWQDVAPLVTFTAGANTGPTVAVAGGRSAAGVYTTRGSNPGVDWVAVSFDARSNLIPTRALPLTFSVSGPNLPGGVLDLAPRSQYGSDRLHGSVWLPAAAPATPAVGDRYDFSVGYTDGSSEPLQASVTGLFGGAPAITAPTQGATDVSTTPTFQLSAPPSPSTPYQWLVDLSGSRSDRPWWSTYLPSATTSFPYDVDGGAVTPQLPGFTMMVLNLLALDLRGNSAQRSVSFTTGAPQLALFDPLSSATLDGQRWQTGQFARSVVGGQALLSVQADHMQSRYVQNLGYQNQMNVQQAAAGGRVTTLRADVTVPAATASRDGGAFIVGGVRLNYQPAADRGLPFPAGTSNFTTAAVELYDDGGGPKIRARAFHCADPSCITVSDSGIAWSALPAGFTLGSSGVNAIATAAYDQTYTFTVSMNETTHVFTWTVAGGAFGTGVSGSADLSGWVSASGLQLDSSTNGFSSAQLSARLADETLAGGSNGALTAEFDNVYVGTNGGAAALYDDFATMGSDATAGLSIFRWGTGSGAALNGSAELAAGLHLRAAHRAPGAASAMVSTTASVLYPPTFNTWQADLSIAADSNTSGVANQDYVQMGGAFMNDGSGGPNDATGDILGNVILKPNGASYWIGRCSNPSCGSQTTVAAGPIPGGSVPFGVGTTHTALEQWDPASMTATVRIDDGPPVQLSPPLGDALPPFVPSRYLQGGVSIPAGHPGATAAIDAVVSNVRIVP